MSFFQAIEVENIDFTSDLLRSLAKHLGVANLPRLAKDEIRRELEEVLSSLVDGKGVQSSIKRKETTEAVQPSYQNVSDVSCTITLGTEISEDVLIDILEVVSMTTTFYIYTRWYSINPGRNYEYRIKLFDGSGNIVWDSRTSLEPDDYTCSIWSSYRPDIRTEKAGQWKAEIYLEGQKMGEKIFSVIE